MPTHIPLPVISYTAAMFGGAVFCLRLYYSYQRDKQPYTLYFLFSVIAWTAHSAIKGLAPIFFPNNLPLWEIFDSISYIIIAEAIASGYRFLLSLIHSKWATPVFYLTLILCLSFTPLDFIYSGRAEIVPPGVVVWNDHPLLSGVFATMMGSVILLSIFFFLTRAELKNFLVQLRLALFIVFYGLIGFGGVLLFISPDPRWLLAAHFSITMGAVAMFLTTLVRFLEKKRKK